MERLQELLREKTLDEIPYLLPDPKDDPIYVNHEYHFILCKPKLMPLKSVTLEKLEKMQKDAEIKLRESQLVEASKEEN